ncbi:acyl carrier protein [Jidongwangia harbinensis]|uniref:acyl carrier protein n=1 Tax=Jidongwangia harbinensis TaxID=2878561 RepID=UPI001CD92986|nr:acyl carrier protein [Jidongwangia harbinensis]MCA2219205.1 acyl carrier protein [Jidongwangia harbinensis]
MPTFTLADLNRVIQEGAGRDGNADWDSDVLDQPFSDLGYDSLALLETASRVEREFGARIADDVATELRTPRSFVDHVNHLLGAASARP